MKHDAIVEQGIPIHERVPIPEDMIPEDSRVEIDAKIHAGYCMLCHDTLPFPLALLSCFGSQKHIYKDFPLIGQSKANGGNMINTVTTGKVMSLEELSEVKGRAWDDVDVSSTFSALLLFSCPFSTFSYSSYASYFLLLPSRSKTYYPTHSTVESENANTECP